MIPLKGNREIYSGEWKKQLFIVHFIFYSESGNLICLASFRTELLRLLDSYIRMNPKKEDRIFNATYTSAYRMYQKCRKRYGFKSIAISYGT